MWACQSIDGQCFVFTYWQRNCRAQGKGKIQKQKDFALKHDIKIGLPPTTHHPPTTHPPENFFWYQWILGQILRHFYWWVFFFKTQAIKRYRPFNFENLLIRRLWIDINLSKSYPKSLWALKGVPIRVTGGVNPVPY